MLADFIIFFIMESYLYLQRGSISRIAFHAFLNRIFFVFFAQFEVNKFQTQLSAIVFNRGNVIKSFLQAIGKEPVIRVLLNFNQIRHLKNFSGPLIAHSKAFACFNRTDPVFLH